VAVPDDAAVKHSIRERSGWFTGDEALRAESPAFFIDVFRGVVPAASEASEET
jgi:hypothetical protein